MARIDVEGPDVVVRLSLLEKLGSFRGDIRVPLKAVTSATAEAHPWGALRGVRTLGTAMPGVIAYGVRRRINGDRDFAALVAGRSAIRIDLDASSPFARLVLSVSDAQASASTIRCAAGI